MPLFCSVNDFDRSSYEFEVQVLMGEKVDPNTDLASIMTHAAALAASVKKLHADATAASGRLLGQDRIDLIAELDRLFIALLALRERLRRAALGQKKEVTSTDFRVPFRKDTEKYAAGGYLRRDHVDEIQDFRQTFDTLIVDRFKQMVGQFQNGGKEALNSLLSPEMFAALDSLFYNLLLLRFNIEQCRINN